jgi:uncharacterized protein
MISHLVPGKALVTGASSGIGAVYAEKLARRGFDLVLVGRSADRLSALAKTIIADTGRKVEVLAADLADGAGIAKVESRLRADSSLTLLVNNAGLAAVGPLTQAEPKAVADMLTVNVLALTRLAAAGGAAFASRKRGAVVNMASAMAFLDLPHTAAYASSKAYVLNFSLSLDLELAPLGVQVQVVLPGYTRTPMIGDGVGLPPEMVMEVDDLVEASLTGFDRKELVTIPSLEVTSRYEDWAAARTALQPFLSLAVSAPRYLV